MERVVCSVREGLDFERPLRLGVKYRGEKQERKDHLATTKALRLNHATLKKSP